MLGEEFRQARQHEMARHAQRHVDAQPAAQRGAARPEHRAQFLEIGEQFAGALVERLAVLRQLHAARGAVEQARPQLRLEALHASRDLALGDTEVVGGEREARQLRHAHEGLQVLRAHRRELDCPFTSNSLVRTGDLSG